MRSVSSRLSEHAINLAMVAGLLVIVGFVLGAGLADYPALAADEDNYLEQAWTLNHDGLSHATSWYDRARWGGSSCGSGPTRSGRWSAASRRPRKDRS